MKRPSPALWLGAASLAVAAVMWAFGWGWTWVPLLFFIALCIVAPFKPQWGLFFPAISHGPRAGHNVVLTFDDGPDPETTPALLDLLDTEGVKACFFVIGEKARQNPDLVQRILERGHEIGNHSGTHDPLLMLRTGKRLAREIDACQEVLGDLGVKPLCFRPPAGIVNPKLGPLLAQRGMTCVLFSLRPADFGNRRIRGLAKRVLSRVRPGDIMLLHDRRPAMPYTKDEWLDETRRIIRGLRERGLVPVTLSAMFGIQVMETVRRQE